MRRPVLSNSFNRSRIVQRSFIEAIPPSSTRARIVRRQVFKVPVFKIEGVRCNAFTQVQVHNKRSVPIARGNPFSTKLPFNPDLRNSPYRHVVRAVDAGRRILRVHLESSSRVRIARSTKYPPRVLVLGVNAVQVLRRHSRRRIRPHVRHVNRIRFHQRTETLHRTSMYTVSVGLDVAIRAVRARGGTLAVYDQLRVRRPLMRTHEHNKQRRQQISKRQRQLINVIRAPVPIGLPRVQRLRLVPVVNS